MVPERGQFKFSLFDFHELNLRYQLVTLIRLVNVVGTFKPLWQLRQHLTLFPLYVLNKTKLMYQYVNGNRNFWGSHDNLIVWRIVHKAFSQWDRIDFTLEEKPMSFVLGFNWVSLLIYYYIGVSRTCRNSFIPRRDMQSISNMDPIVFTYTLFGLGKVYWRFVSVAVIRLF